MHDYSVYLIAARKALANAEEWAAIHDWERAGQCMGLVAVHVEECGLALAALEIAARNAVLTKN